MYHILHQTMYVERQKELVKMALVAGLIHYLNITLNRFFNLHVCLSMYNHVLKYAEQEKPSYIFQNNAPPPATKNLSSKTPRRYPQSAQTRF